MSQPKDSNNFIEDWEKAIRQIPIGGENMNEEGLFNNDEMYDYCPQCGDTWENHTKGKRLDTEAEDYEMICNPETLKRQAYAKLLRDKPRYYIQDINNYNEEFLKKIITWQEEYIKHIEQTDEEYEHLKKEGTFEKVKQ